MDDGLSFVAQVSTGHTPLDRLHVERVLAVLEAARGILPLRALVVGWVEAPGIYHALIDAAGEETEVYLWYPLLSDYPGMADDHLVVNLAGERSRGWGEFVAGGEIQETFRFACPNRPEVQEISLFHLERLLTTYDFDGVFLDKFRFPSPANGLEEMLSCFCPDCYRAAASWGLDLDEVKACWRGVERGEGVIGEERGDGGWLDRLLAGLPELERFVRFRCAVIARLVERVYALVEGVGKRLALDIFTPGLASLVGQDYKALREYSVWMKPMIYRLARGPAGLRLEVPALVRDVARWLGKDVGAVWRWVEEQEPSLAGVSLDQVEREGVPLSLVAAEMRRAVELADPVPVYVGVETVSIPGVLQSDPDGIKAVAQVALESGVGGLVLSWDLLHTPLENLRALEGYR